MVKVIFSDDEKKWLINEIQTIFQNEYGKKVSKTKLNDVLTSFANSEGYWFEDRALDRFKDWCINVEKL